MFVKTDNLGRSEILDDEDINHLVTTGGTYGPWPDWFIDSLLLASPTTSKDTKEGIRRDQIQKMLDDSTKTGHISRKKFKELVDLYIRVNPTANRKTIEDKLFNELSNARVTFE